MMQSSVFAEMQRKFRSSRSPYRDLAWSLLLWGVALILFTRGLDQLPLRDWDEGTVAQVAREIWQHPDTWLHPTLHGQPYLNKPPLLHNLIALSYHWFGSADAGSARLPGAILTATSVPLLYYLGRELWPHRAPALWASIVYLTWLPVVRHGRLAMLDGAILCFCLLWMLCLLRTRRNLRYALGVGLALSLVGLTKGLMLALLFGAISLGFLLWDTPRLLTHPGFGLGMTLGAVPLGAWYLAQWTYYGQDFLIEHLLNQSAHRVWQAVERNSGPPWYYLIEFLKYGFPAFIFVPAALKRVWQDQNLSWARLILVWSGGYFGAISLMGTKLPWYSLPIYPPLALGVGVILADIWQQLQQQGHPSRDPRPCYPKLWRWGFVVMALVAWGGAAILAASLMESGFLDHEMTHLTVTLLAAAMTLTMTASLIAQRNPMMPMVLFWGWLISLLLFVTSSDWVWELNEDYPVQPVATMIREETQGEPIYTSHPYDRPSLNFYANRPIISASPHELYQHWHGNQRICLLLDYDSFEQLGLDGGAIVGLTEDWLLLCHEEPGTMASPTRSQGWAFPPS
ncbi:MAG: ArnT family glycosyltransferase [Cyanobacteriota bacterium]